MTESLQYLLEDLEGDGGVLDGYDDPAMVQIQNMVLLLKHLDTGRKETHTGNEVPQGALKHGSYACGNIMRGL